MLAEVERLGVASGTTVRVVSHRAAVTLPIEGSDSVPVGVAFVAFAQAGSGAAELIDATQPVTDVRIERVGTD